MKVFVQSPPGLGAITATEIAELDLTGVARLTTAPGGVSADVDPHLLPHLLLRLGSAERVLVELGRFRARGFPQLERQAAVLDVASVFDGARPVQVEVSSRKSRLYHTGAIEERLRRSLDLGDAAPDERDQEALRLVVRVVRDEFRIWVDAAGSSLHRRGYRLRTAKAPLRETLAHALIRASGWRPGMPLIDPFCGSGTIPIEAARWAMNIAPGSQREFDAERWPSSASHRWTEARKDVAAEIAVPTEAQVFGSDRDSGAVEAALDNGERAGVSKAVVFERAPFSDAHYPPQAILVTNPPYGRRIGGGDLRDLFARLAQIVAANEVGGVTMVTPDVDTARRSGLRLEKLYDTLNGGIDVTVGRSSDA